MIYVVIQFVCIIYLIINARFEHLDTLKYALLGAATVIGVSAVVNIKPDNLNIVPTLKDKHKLITHGIYRFIRHPMYTSVLLLSFTLTLTHSHYLSQLIMFILLVDLILKSNLEEKLLTERFSTYQDYKNNTGRFLPFL